MDPVLTNLLAASASMSGVQHDQKMLMKVYLDATLFRVPNDWPSLSTFPDGFSSLSPDQMLNIEVYATAKRLSLPTDGLTLQNYVNAQIGNPSPQGATLPLLFQNVVFKYIKAY